MLSKFKDKFYDLCDYLKEITPLADDCYKFADEYYKELKVSKDNLEEKTQFRRNILYLNSIKKYTKKIDELINKIEFKVEEIEDVDMWVPKDLTLPLGIYRYPSLPPTKEFLAHFPKNQP